MFNLSQSTIYVNLVELTSAKTTQHDTIFKEGLKMKRPLSNREQTFLEFFLAKSRRISSIIREISKTGGASYLVGGAVRDLVLKARGGTVVMKDIDIEVHDIEMEKLKEIYYVFYGYFYVGP